MLRRVFASVTMLLRMSQSPGLPGLGSVRIPEDMHGSCLHQDFNVAKRYGIKYPVS